MHTYIHKVNYYETDKMGITHHSNYVRWMEEAKMDFMKAIGLGMKEMESAGFTSPVVSIECRYKHTTTFDDEIKIDVSVEEYNGVKLSLAYVMTDRTTGAVVSTGRSSNCFIDADGRPIAVKKHFPDFDEAIKGHISNN